MNQVPPHLLWIGHAGDGRDVHHLRGLGIEVVVQVAMEEQPWPPPRDLIYLRFPLNDGGDNRPEILDLAFRSVAGAIVHRLPTLVCCGAGMSRSPAIAAAALSVSGHGSPEECLEIVSRHSRTDVSPGLWSSLRAVVSTISM